MQTLLQPEVYIPKWLNVSLAKAGGKRQSNATTTTTTNNNNNNNNNNNVQTDVATGIDGDISSESGTGSGTGTGADPNKGIPNSGLTQAPLLLAVARYSMYKIR